MKKDVLVTVRGMQSIESVDGSEEVEMVAKGNYYFRNGHHFICYEEMSEGFDKPTKSMIKIADNVVEVDKKGVMNTHLVFEPEKKNVTFYATLSASCSRTVKRSRRFSSVLIKNFVSNKKALRLSDEKVSMLFLNYFLLLSFVI